MNKFKIAAILAAGAAIALSPANVAAQSAPPFIMGFGLKQNAEGAEVAFIGPGSTAAALGLKIGDIITELDGKPISPEVANAHAQKTKLGDEVKVKVKRDGAIVELTAKAVPAPGKPQG
jgi:S1-C subfamily serine protease